MRSHLKLQPEWRGEAVNPVGYQISGEVPDDLAEIVRQSVQPMSPSELGRELTKLAAKTKRRDNGDIDTSIVVAAYVEDLIEYPADVVNYVLKKAAKENVFFPAWAELYEDLEFWGRDRIRLYEAVKAKQGE